MQEQREAALERNMEQIFRPDQSEVNRSGKFARSSETKPTGK
ncbi:MAG: hypothetical protein ACR2NN_19465 [Bryobacteraceae bacterium]